VNFLWVDEDRSLSELVKQLSDEDRIALDTEFHRERTYYPRLALIQISWSKGTAIVDPLACHAELMVPLFGPDRTIIFHAAQQDLDVLAHAVGAIPESIFDTQIAAGFLGYSTPSLASLVNSELKIALPKGDRLTDWLRRPLTEGQLSYAASDVEYLLVLHDQLTSQLADIDRLQWAVDACRELREKRVGPPDPAEAWMRQKDVRTMRPRTRGVLASLAEWRERRAMASDVPPRQILPDLALQGISQREPTTVADLGQARGVDERHTRGPIAQEILDAVRRGRENPLDLPSNDGEDVERHLRPAITLMSAWISEVARMKKVDTALLATRHDIVQFLKNDPQARLAHGWRNDLVGEQLRALLSGQAGLSFDGRGGLRMITAEAAEH
jgi:ribonuclease D